MVIALLVLSGCIIILYVLSAGKYDSTIKAIDKKQYPFKDIAPIGLYLIDLFKFNFNSSYNRRLLTAITELSGRKAAYELLRVHWGSKIALMLISLAFALFAGAFSMEISCVYIAFCICLPIGIAYFSDKDLFERVKKRRLSIQLEFPDFVNKLTLLINAGMTVSRAWERVASDSSKSTPIYAELRQTLQDIRSGMAEHKAYEEFAKRCGVPVITRFISVILQNLRKGNAELVPILRVFSNECWELRKNTAKKCGEEASTKLLMPMMLMLIAIIIIVGMPAVLALRNI